MFFLYDANLKLLKTIPSDVYQGSDGADDIYFLVPINPNAAINVAFLLPTGKTLTSRPATKQGEAVGLETPDGISYAMWSITLTAQETAYAGNVTLQITVISGAMRMTSQKGVFPVLTGVPPVLPEAPQADAYNDIRAAIAALQTAVYNTKAIGISTYSYNESKKNATIKSYVTSATRVVVPDYVIKGDEYYIVTGIDPNVKPPTSVTEYEFGSNITSIGAGAFVETNITRLEFPKNLTSIGDSAFTDATTTEIIFNGAVPTIGSFAFSGVNATAYVPAVYYNDYVAAFETYPGIVVQKKSETLADVIETADEAKAIALKAQSTADEVKTELNGKVDKSAIVQEKGTATDKVMSQKAVTDELKEYVKQSKNESIVYGTAAGIPKPAEIEYSDLAIGSSLAYRDFQGELAVADATSNENAVNLGQLTTKLLNYLLNDGTDQTFTGNLAIQKNLTVRGTTTTTKEETLNVKDAIVVTNADGADLSATLAGFVIRLNATDCYGIIYDASSESVKLGKGKITNGKFTFNSGEGNAVAIRADGSLMTNGHLVKWDATALKFVDAGKSVTDFVLKRNKTGDYAYGIVSGYEGTWPISTTPTSLAIPHYDSRTLNLRTSTPVADLDCVNKQYFEAKGWLLRGGTLIPENADLNDYATVGTYSSANDSVAGTIKNTPYKYAFKLIVETFSVYTTQTLRGQTGRDLFLRCKTGAGWGSWERLASTSDIPQGFKTIFDQSITGSGSITPYEAYLNWGGKNIAANFGPLDAALIPSLGANRLAFMPPDAITVEYSRDGGETWVDYPTNNEAKTALFCDVGTPYYIGGDNSTGIDKSKYMVRFTINTGAAYVYTELKKFAIYLSTEGSSGCYCTITGRLQSNVEAGTETWETFVDKASVGGWSGWNILNTSIITYGSSKPTQYGQVRFTFGVESHPSTVAYRGLTIEKILGFGGVGWSTPSTMAAKGRMYTWDWEQNVFFPQSIYANNKKLATEEQLGSYLSKTGITSQAGLTITQTSSGVQVDSAVLIDNSLLGG